LTQLHAAQYRSAADLPPGRVLVVGSGQSGCQIAADLLDAGRDIVVSTSNVGRVPTPYRGREMLHWLVTSGFYDARTEDVEPVVRAMPIPLLAPAGRPLGLPTLLRRGAQLAGRPVAVDDGWRLDLDDSAQANVTAGEAFAVRLRALADGYIERSGVDAPPAAPDPDAEPVTVAAVPTLDLRGLGAVVWCTGFGGDFGWLPEPLTARGAPVLHGVCGAVDGLYAVGLRWLTRRCSSILHGFPVDAADVATRVRAHLG
jgi:putative flavoprotein involved in K+ transport